MTLRRYKSNAFVVATMSALILVFCAAAFAATPEFHLSIQDHRFSPAELTVPAGTKFRLIVENRDATAEEFESYDLNREKVVAARASIVVFLGPLKPGRYEFFGDFNPTLARGFLVVK